MSNVDSARSAYEAFNRGDLATLKESYAGNAVWTSSAEVQPGGERKGRDAVMELFAELPDYWSTVSLAPTEFIDGGEYVTIVGTLRVSNDKGSAESPFANVVKFDDEGKVVRQDFYWDTAKAAKLQA